MVGEASMCIALEEARVYCGGASMCLGFDVFINLSLDVTRQGWWYRVLPLAFPRFLLQPLRSRPVVVAACRHCRRFSVVRN